ncbi:MAG: tetratricopeptide repeat protein [Pseudonocardiaceae bacterium]
MIGTGLRCLQDGDRETARRWFAQAARTDDPAMLADLGAIYDQSMNDIGYAESCYRRAANGGSIMAMNNLGVLLKSQDRLHEAEQWLRRAAASGDADALNNLSNVMDRRGDTKEALGYFRQAAEAGQSNAMCTLGIHLVLSGHHREARQWYRRAEATRNSRIQGPLMMLGALLSESKPPMASLRSLFSRWGFHR